jgi:hypothetical protein
LNHPGHSGSDHRDQRRPAAITQRNPKLERNSGRTQPIARNVSLPVLALMLSVAPIPQKYTRVGVPDGMRKAEATKAWDAARSLADAFVTTWEASGIVAKVTVPDSDEEQAKACLREACVLALGPSDKRTKLSAANTILKFTMARPTVTTSTEITSAEDWLKAATTHHRQPPLLTTDAQVIQ